MSRANDLERLSALHRSGTLDDAEFAIAKSRALASASDAACSLCAVGACLRGLRHSCDDRWFGGVCGGLAPATGLPSWLSRVVVAALVPCAGTGAMFYVLLWTLLPVEDDIVDVGGAVRAG